MVTLDLMAKDHYPPLDGRSPEELFDLAMAIALALDDVQVRTPTGGRSGEAVVLDSRMLRQDGAKLF